MKVVFLTTSYPRWDGDPAGNFVESAARLLRGAGVEIDVVSPADFRHFGIAYGHGIAGNLRRYPWRLALLPAFLWNYARAARRAARDADLVHAHWLPSGFAAWATGRPFVVQLWGTDAELARRAPRLFRPVVRAARLVISPSAELGAVARALGAQDVRLIPGAVAIPESVGPPQDPPHVLFVGRLAPEKGALEFAAASEGLPRVIIGDGPLRGRIPDARGFVPSTEVGAYFERAAVVCVPSLREGFGVACAEATAYGRPVVASAVGGLRDHVQDGVTGLLVPPGDVAGLRAALERLLGDEALRTRFGAAAREQARQRLDPKAVAAATVDAYRAAIG